MSKLTILMPYCDALRLAAVGALLHNLGKISSHFIEKQLGVGQPNYLYQHIVQLIDQHCTSLLAAGLWDGCTHLADSNILQHSTKSALSGNTFSFSPPFNDREYAIGDLIEYLGQGEPWYQKTKGQFGIEHIFPQGSRLTHLMNRAHRGASGGEKQGIAAALQPDPHRLWLSTPFGWEVPACSVLSCHTSTHPDINVLRQQIEQKIAQYLTRPATPFPIDNFVKDLRS